MNRKFWQNVSSLYSVHILNYVVPMLTLPYLARMLGASNWGALALADAYAAYVSLLVEYCFGLSASREIARVQEDREARSRHLAGVLLAQVLLATIAFLATFVIANFVPMFAPYRPLLPWSYVLAVARAVMPAWYFQGLERMGIVAIPNIIINLVATAGIFLLVHGPKDTWIPLALRAGAAVLGSVVAFYFAYREVPFIRPKISYARLALREGGSLFLFKSAVSLFTTANVLILGFFAPAMVVGWYAGAEKIARAAINGIQPLSQSFYPRLSHQLETDPKQAAATLRFSARITIGLGLLVGVLLFVFAPLLIRLALGKGFAQAVPVLRTLAFLAPLAATTNVFGIQWMLALRLDALFTRIVLGAGVLNVILAILLAPRFQHMGMAISVVIADIFVASVTLIILKKKSLDPWSSSRQPRVADSAPEAVAS